jgi:hypothetical protein
MLQRAISALGNDWDKFPLNLRNSRRQNITKAEGYIEIVLGNKKLSDCLV